MSKLFLAAAVVAGLALFAYDRADIGMVMDTKAGPPLTMDVCFQSTALSLSETGLPGLSARAGKCGGARWTISKDRFMAILMGCYAEHPGEDFAAITAGGRCMAYRLKWSFL